MAMQREEDIAAVWAEANDETTPYLDPFFPADSRALYFDPLYPPKGQLYNNPIVYNVRSIDLILVFLHMK